MTSVCKSCGAILAKSDKAGRPFEFCSKCQHSRVRRNYARRQFVKGLGFGGVTELVYSIETMPDVVKLLQGAE